MPQMMRRWIVSQIGSREHYAVARAAEAAGTLELLITDYWCRRGRSLLAAAPAGLRALAGRWAPEIPADRVASFNLETLFHALRARGAGSSAERMSQHYLRVGEAFGRASARVLRRRRLSRDGHIFFAYCTGALEPLQLLAEQGIPTIVDQIDPARWYVETVRAEQEKWPGWEPREADVSAAYWQRLEAEWQAADVVVVNSSWSKEALIEQGVPAAKIAVLPLAYEAAAPAERRYVAQRPLSVLFLGTVCLRKGIQYLLGAARLLAGENITFTIAGPIDISAEAVATAPQSVTFLGRVTRDRLGEVYGAADLFVFPTLSDAFGITQLEAMAHGLPVIATPRCGTVVEDGVNGFIVPAGDAEPLAQAILRLARDRTQLAQMSKEAVRRAREFSLDGYFRQLKDELARLGVAAP